MSRPRALLSFSSGKDSAWALHVARERGELEIVGLLTTINETHERVAMHAVRRELLQAQARAVGLPLLEVPLPHPCDNETYEARMRVAVEKARADDITHMIFGDLYLEDIRAYRESKLDGTGISPAFPLWQMDTSTLAHEMMQAGVVAHLSTVDPKQISPEFVGRKWDESLLAELPATADPCGENGEFHTFVSAGPMFHHPIDVVVDAPIERDGFFYCDIRPRTG